MNIHSFIEYVKYRWVAKDRHGVHSPFAYELSEKTLTAKPENNTRQIIQTPAWVTPRYKALINILARNYKYNNLYLIPADEPLEIPPQDMLIFSPDNPGNWVRHFNKYQQFLSQDSAVLVYGIHSSRRHSAKWKRLYTHPKVMMSIDLYNVGLLFFRKEFKEKQHFVLKY